MYIVFDTETTGKPISYSAPIQNTENWPRVVQIAWKLYDKDGVNLETHNYIIKPDGFTISEEVAKIHRITQERAEQEGIPLIDAINIFEESAKKARYLIAHNISFDEKVVGCELIRLNKRLFIYDCVLVDTMKTTIDFCAIKARRGGGYKYPSLSELYLKLFNELFSDAHDALVDVSALAKVFFELQRLGVLGYQDKGLQTDVSREVFSRVSLANSNEEHKEGEYKKLVNLCVHSFHSILEGAGSISNYVKKAKKTNQPAIAITDISTMSGTFELYEKCKANGIKSIIGCEFCVNEKIGIIENGRAQGESYRLKVYAKNDVGYKNMCKILYLANTDGFYQTGRIKPSWLFENKEGLMVTTSSLEGKVSLLLQKGKQSEAESYIKELVDELGMDNVYAEIQLSSDANQKTYNNFVISMADRYKIKIILTNNSFFVEKEDAEIQNVVQALKQKVALEDARLKDNADLFFYSSDDYFFMNIKNGFNYPDRFLEYCFKNSLTFAERCNFEFETGVEKYPRYEPTQDVIDYFGTSNPEEIIYKLAFAKLKQKLKFLDKRGIIKLDDEISKKYHDQLKYELDIIRDKKMLDYFLVNWEIIRDYRSKGYITGPARGSAAGCLLSYCLDITKIDPLRFGLYFERFLNPTRNNLVDIDTDFMKDTDQIMDDFLYKKYGKERVLNVGTFLTFNEKGCLKDVVRTIRGKEATSYGSSVAVVTDEMPNFEKDRIKLEDWLRDWPKDERCSDIARDFLNDPENKKILDITLKLQGQIRGIGQHAAGVVITPKKSWDVVPTNVVGKEETKSLVTAFQEADKSGKDLSTLGILKLDRLKLETLNVIKATVDLVKETKDKDITDDVDYVNLDDENLFKEVSLGMNHGIFQFESPGMNSLLKNVKVSNFNELTACNALYRPGPMKIGAHNEFIKNKFKPGEAKYVHESLREIFSDSNGVMIYQEQLMFIANKIGKMTLGDGDSLRRAMDRADKFIEKEVSGGKLTEEELNNKEYKLFQKYWNMFLDGAENNGFNKDEVNSLKAYLIKYLGYSFNKCLSKNHKVISKERGEINILDVKIGEEILGFNTKTKNDEFNKVKAIHKNGKKRVFNVIFDSGRIVESTLDHKFLTDSNDMLSLDDIYDFNVATKTIDSYDGITQMCEVGMVDTYDLEIDSEDHNFYANGVCVSNSHSVSYAYLAMQTLFLKHYYPTEFYTSLLNHAKTSGKPEEIKQWITSSIISAMARGITIKPPSRKSGWNWKMTGDNEISMGFSAIKGFGDIAYQELVSLLKDRGRKFEEISKYGFLELPLAKFSKATFEAALKAGVFDDWSPSREEMVDLFQKSKKANKKRSLTQMSLFGASYEPELKHNEVKFKPTQQRVKNEEFIEVCNFDLDYVERIFKIKDEIKKRSKVEVNGIGDFYAKGFYWFMLESKVVQKTKTGKKYLLLKVTDGISNTNLRIFGRDVNKVEPILENGSIYVGAFDKNEQGFLNFSKVKKNGDSDYGEIYVVKFEL